MHHSWKKLIRPVLAVILTAAMLIGPVALAASGTTTTQVNLRENATTTSAVLRTVPKGATVTILGSSNGWSRVTYGSTSGFIRTEYIQTNTASGTSRVTVKKNTRHEDVKALQKLLRSMGLYDGDITGNAGDKTVAAIKAFQRQKGLTADGVCGPGTWALLESSNGGTTPANPGTSSTALKKGMTGDAVKSLQHKLISLGYLTGSADGSFGTATENAVKAFQNAKGLTADGIAGTATMTKLNSAVNGPAASSALRKGDKGDAVKSMQQKLISLGYLTGSADGSFGTATENAVKAFQRDKGLTVDGIAGSNTLAKLESAGTSAPAQSGALKIGSSGEEVRKLQRNLRDAGYYSGGVDGEFGGKTAEAVKAFQRANGLTADGIAGNATLTKLANVLAAGTLDTTRTLRKGDKSDAVKSMQQRLINLGYLSGSADGNFGNKTENAVRSFQRANGLTVDGVAGKATLTKLSSSSAVKATASSGSNVSASKVQLLDWFTTVKSTLPRNTDLSIYDCRTGKTYTVRSFSNGNHADVEPVTKTDTEIMLSTYNGKWSWNPRPVWVSYNGITVAASINGMPHASGPNKNNGMDGQVCLHFLNSKTHNGNTSFEKQHQDAVKEAWKAAGH